MAFARKEQTIQAVPLDQLTPIEAEKKITEGVKKYAMRQETWARADKNTPFLGQIIGMGIESANMVDVTMSIEKQFITKMTKKVPVPGTAQFRLEEGEPGKLMVLEGQDTFAATPGLAVKMLMDHGHMPKDPNYLKDLVSFGHIVLIGEGYRLNETLKKLKGRWEKAGDDAAKKEAWAALSEQIKIGRSYVENAANIEMLKASRHQNFMEEKNRYDAVSQEIAHLTQQMESADEVAKAGFKSKIAAAKIRLSRQGFMLQVVEGVAKDCAIRNEVEEREVLKVKSELERTLADLSK